MDIHRTLNFTVLMNVAKCTLNDSSELLIFNFYLKLLIVCLIYLFS